MSKAGETAVFTYNADGLRVKKVCTTTGTTNYTLHGKNVVHLSNGSNNLHFFYDAQNRPSVVVFNGTAYGYVHNLQGDIIAIANSAGTIVVEYTYDPWGKPLTKAGTLASTLGTLNPFRYRGYIYDEETGLYYLRSRYYSAMLCRFLNADGVLGRIGKSLRHHIMGYCLNSPVNWLDRDGNECSVCQDGCGTSYEVFVLNEYEITVLLAWLDNQYPNEKVKKPLEEVVENLAGISVQQIMDQGVEYMANNGMKALGQYSSLKLLNDLVNGVCEPYALHDQKFGTFLTNQIARDKQLVGDVSTLKVTLSFSHTADEIGLEYYDEKGNRLSKMVEPASSKTLQRLYEVMKRKFPKYQHGHFNHHLETMKDLME